VLETLDHVNWASLRHAYGSAVDTPRWLHGLASDQAEVRENARKEVWASVLHQGSIYPATPHVVPFLLELLRAEGVADKVELLYLLHGCATGYSHLNSIAIRRDESNRCIWDRPGFEEERRKEVEAVAAAARAVADATPTYAGLLSHPDAGLRSAAARVLGWCVARFPEAEQVLAMAIPREKDAAVKAVLLDAYRQLYQSAPPETAASPEAFLVAFFREPTEAPVVRAVAALAVLGLPGGRRTPEALEVLRQVLPEAEAPFERLPRDPARPLAKTLLAELADCLRGQTETLLPFLIDLARHPVASVRADALHNLARLTQRQRDLLPRTAPVLAAAVVDPDPDVRQAAEEVRAFDGELLHQLLAGQPEPVRRRVEACCWAARAARCETSNRHAEALPALDEAIRLDPGRVDFHKARARVYEKTNDTARYRAELETILRLDPDDVNSLRDRAGLRRLEGDHEGVVADCTRALANVGRVAWVDMPAHLHVLRGRSWRVLGRPDLAEEDFTRALASITQRQRVLSNSKGLLSLAYSLRGQVRNERGRHDLALADFADARRHFPKVGMPAKFSVAKTEGDWAAAEAAFAAAVADFPCEPRVYRERAFALWVPLGNFEHAFEDYATALSLDASDPLTYYRRGLLHEQLGHDREAERDFARVLALDPNHRPAARRLAEVRARLAGPSGSGSAGAHDVVWWWCS
jgi:tetratricopeptide (TPR) repeat protein